MTKSELIKVIQNGNDIAFMIGDRGYTVCTWTDGGPNIGEWDKPETAQTFPSAESLVEKYYIQGKPLGELAHLVRITEYA